MKSFIRTMKEHIMGDSMLNVLDIDREHMSGLLDSTGWDEKMQSLAESRDYSADRLADVLSPLLANFVQEPQEGWLKAIYDRLLAHLYPESFSFTLDPGMERAAVFFIEQYEMLLEYEKETRGFSPVDHIELLDEKETSGCVCCEEYRRFRNFWKEYHVYGFMRLGREITSYNTVGHIGGVHYLSVFTGRQLKNAGVPVDTALLSAAAAGHDLGKYGCRPQEAKRIPYLHYYYTDRLLRRENMPMTAHIASNHSTWDLELENLSVESLLLIYADFRVKSSRENGIETVHFYTLEEAFDVILGKLDNVDGTKKHRYEKVYAKLLDFENYMKSLGVVTDIDESVPQKPHRACRDISLLNGREVVEQLKYTAIEHNIRIMSLFNNEISFGSLLESARSEKQWKSLRAYLDILSEYCTYMTKQEKQLTAHFLYDLLCHREGDIRRQAGRLLGVMIADYDEVYSKELPAGVQVEESEGCVGLWDTYLKKIVFPDNRVTDQHRSWIGYTLKQVMQGIFDKADAEMRHLFAERYFTLFGMKEMKDSEVFVLQDSVTAVPDELFGTEELMTVLGFAAAVSARDSEEIKIGSLRAAEYVSRRLSSEKAVALVSQVLENTVCHNGSVSVRHLMYRILVNTGHCSEAEFYGCAGGVAGCASDEAVSAIFRENLKMGTPWVVKAVNIDYLLETTTKTCTGTALFHMASHFSNLVKVSERVTVRHRAGRGLVEIAGRLPDEQLNEIVIELTKGLEIGEYQFSKYIPQYLGEIVLFLHPGELDEFTENLAELTCSTNDRIGSVALDTVGEVLKKYPQYRYRSSETAESYERRKKKLLGLLLKGLASYNEVVCQESFMVTGQYIFGSSELTLSDKFSIFKVIYKKMLTLITASGKYDMTFFTNAAALNHIYRFISEYRFSGEETSLPEKKNVAFFPGTFDPFSLGHKGIVQAIRNEGFEVYLALDEFSWSKKTQPRMIRKKIMDISVADETDVFVFPDDFPVNIANPHDLKKLDDAFGDRDVYIVVGSDVIANASSYRAEPEEHSIHSMNHIVFRRETLENSDDCTRAGKMYPYITGRIRELALPVYLEDISSTRIRENIDQGRDISGLIDPVAQNFIYANSLYLREPQYKSILEARHLRIEPPKLAGNCIPEEIMKYIHSAAGDPERAAAYIGRADVMTSVIKNSDGIVCALAAFNEIETGQLLSEFGDLETAAYFRKKSTGRIVLIQEICCQPGPDCEQMIQMVLTEVLADAAGRDVTYAVCRLQEQGISAEVENVLERQGFTKMDTGRDHTDIYEVSMKEPVVIIDNMDTVLKEPFSESSRILDVLDKAHKDMQTALTRLYPGNLVLSFDSGVMNQKIVHMVTSANGVPDHPLAKRTLGECMCVPFSKTMRGAVIPNTVTKALHTEKVFTPELDGFVIEEYPMYSTISDQVKTIRSFGRPVILVDDILHKGYRLRALSPVFSRNDLKIRKIITGIMSGQGKDLMTVQGREAESAYFIPDLRAWFVSSTMYPFIGGDGVRSEEKTEASLIPSINLVLPFAAPGFLRDADRKSVYDLSRVCLTNACRIFEAVEAEYQSIFERKLTVRKLSDAVRSPRMPNGSNRVAVDLELSPSVYMYDYLERLKRLESALI